MPITGLTRLSPATTYVDAWVPCQPLVRSSSKAVGLPARRLEVTHAKQQPLKAANDAKRAVPLLAGLAEAQDSLQARGVSLGKLVQLNALLGVTFGWAFQVTHNQGLLPVYDLWPFQVGPFFQSGAIPFLLAPIWILYGYLYPILDEYFDDAEVDAARGRSTDIAFLSLTWTALAATFVLSDWLYINEVPTLQTSGILALTAIFNWWSLDRTKTGLILGALLAFGAPTCESLIVNFLHFWHYDRPDFFGVPHWAGWCYAAYAYGVGNFARYLQQKQVKDAETR